MKGAGKTILGVSIAVVFLLLYVHEQIALLHVSYTLEDKSEKILRLSEEYRNIKFELDQLKAPRLLEEKIKEMRLNLILPNEVRVLKTSAPPLKESSLKSVSASPMSDRFLHFLGRWVDIAQAKTDN